ncbi:MAG: AAA family ATPase, partial [Bacteroidota bacterium]
MKSRFLNQTIIDKNRHQFGRIIILTGARQTGKTTLARKAFPDYTYLSIEDPMLRGDYARLTAGQWALQYPNAILDEVQKEPVLIESIKSVYDQYEIPRYILLGSSQILLMQKVKESLAGRCSIYEVYPLTIPEMLTNSWSQKPRLSFFQHYCQTFELSEVLPSFHLNPEYPQIIKIFENYLLNGSYPALSGDSLNETDKREWLLNYIRTYLERDIRDLAEFTNLEPFVKIQKTTSLLTGQLVNYSQLAREAGISSNTAQRFLNYLELSYQTILLKPWYKNELKRLNKSVKLH